MTISPSRPQPKNQAAAGNDTVHIAVRVSKGSCLTTKKATPGRVAHLLWLRLDHHFIIMRLASASRFT
jgi:hypothetical protein